jgi:hypothetical protein
LPLNQTRERIARKLAWPLVSLYKGGALGGLKSCHQVIQGDLASGHRYIVALRELKNADGKTIRAPEGFRYYRHRLPTRKAPIKRRGSHFEGIFDTLREAGIVPDGPP